MRGELLPLFELPAEPRPERLLALPDSAIAQSRIAGVFSSACSTDVEQGTAWYFDVHNLCIELSQQSELAHISPVHVAGIIAALSPMRSWTDNINKAREAIKTGKARGLGHTVDTAETIWHGFDPEVVISRTGNNPKVQAFFRNIAFPHTSEDVTIDRHMWNLLFDDLGVVEKAGLRFKSAEYQWASAQFKAVADEIGLLPHQLQATAWLAWRRKQGIVDQIADSSQLILDFAAA